MGAQKAYGRGNRFQIWHAGGDQGDARVGLGGGDGGLAGAASHVHQQDRRIREPAGNGGHLIRVGIAAFVAVEG